MASLYIVPTPIGNLSDISERAINVLRQVDRIAAEDTRRTGQLLKALNLDTPLVALHAHNESESTSGILALLKRGEDVAVVSDAGTPLISDPGYELVRACRENQIEVIPLPGPSAVLTALSAAGLPTHRFSFEGFPPAKSKARAGFLESLASEPRTLVLFEAPHRIEAALEDISRIFGPEREIAVCRELTKTYEQIRSGTAAEILEEVRSGEIPRKGEFVLVIRGSEEINNLDADKLLGVLLEEVSPSRAAAMAAKLTSEKKDTLYQRALYLNKRSKDRLESS